MELRSRSRSNTPFLRQSHEKDLGNHVTRTTRRSERTTETVSVDGKSRKWKSQKNRYITSDYSSEDGETVVSSSGMDNIKNQIKEDLAHSSVNGSGRVSALKLYKEAGEYWNKFPKTDYTYSKHSKDRVELAPGVVAMPNMSRRSLHRLVSEAIVSNKETNTESFASEETTYSNFARRLKRPVSTNNNDDDEVFVIRRRSAKELTFFRKVIVYILTVCHIALYPLFYVYNRQQSLFLWFGKTFHKIASRLMLWDTWVLQKNVSTDKKLYGIVGLCLLPLVLFGGLWMLYGVVSGLSEWASTTSSMTTSLPVARRPDAAFDFDDVGFQEKLVRFIEGTGHDVVGRLTEEQLGAIAERLERDVMTESNVEHIVRKLLENEESRRVKQRNLLMETLQEEVAKVRGELDQKEATWKAEIVELLSRMRSENKRENAKLTLEMSRCCRRSFIQVEGYVLKILRDLLGAPNYVASQDDVSKWLHTVFVAKQDLEGRIANLTQHLKSDFDEVIKNNVQVIMDGVSTKISGEISKNVRDGISLNPIDDDRVRKIVSESLAVYDADKTGLVDYAMESAGGQILSTRCTESYQVKTAVLSILGVPVWYPSNTPRTVITPGVKPGECWAFQNFPGFLLVKLSGFVRITSFSLEHLSRKLAPNGKVDSAPRDFEVYGLRVENDVEPMLLGAYKYRDDGEPLQFFPVDRESWATVFDLVELRVLSNHGNPNYTCLYRFRVHGELQNGPT